MRPELGERPIIYGICHLRPARGAGGKSRPVVCDGGSGRLTRALLILFGTPREARGEPRCHAQPLAFVPVLAGRASIRKSPKNQRRASVRRLFCAVGAIASISQTRDNEPSLIESIVDGRSPKTNIGMKPTHPLHSLLTGNQTDETDVLCSAFLDAINDARAHKGGEG